MSILYSIGVVLAKGAYGAFGRYEVEGRERVPRRGPLIVVANHMSNGDPPAVVAAVPRRLFLMAKRGLFAGSLIARILTDVGVHPLDRDGRDVSALLWGVRLLKQGNAVLFFPEGTRSRDARLRRGKTGAAYAALKTGAPVVPVGVTGTENIPGLLRVAMPLCRIGVRIGEPFTVPQPEGPVTRALLERTTDAIMERIAALLPEEYRGYYADRVVGDRVATPGDGDRPA